MPSEAHGSHLRAHLWLLLILLVVAALAWAVDWSSAPQTQQGTEVGNMQTLETPPPPTASDYVSAQQGFQYLVSYTGSGFAPKTFSMQTGETVRFTNNSNLALQVTTDGTTSPVLGRGAYWEHTFSAAGAIPFSAAGGAEGNVTVQ